MYHHLDSEKIVNTLEILSLRINERFPQSGLSRVVGELLKTGQKADERCRWVTKSSPQRTMTAFELQRYLDYCSEMLSMIGKIAALYVQNLNDAGKEKNRWLQA